jgi:hypothetical protein
MESSGRAQRQQGSLHQLFRKKLEPAAVFVNLSAMVKSKATTVAEYLKSLPEDRRAVVSTMRDLILKNLPKGYRETINWGIICYEIPLERYPDTYNKQPLSYLALAAQKNYYVLHAMCVYGDAKRGAWLKSEFKKAGKKLDMGKACIRFKKLEDLPLDVMARVIAAATPEEYIVRYEASRKK